MSIINSVVKTVVHFTYLALFKSLDQVYA